MKRVNTPTVIQMEAVECGAAALAMIMSYYGLKLPLEILRVECGVSRDGSKASNMLKAARKYGLDAKGYRKETESLKSMKMPVIIFWNFNHFIVLEGFGKDKVYLNDPASGKRTVSMEDFDMSFTGIVLTFETTDEFQKGGNSDTIFKSLKNRFSSSWTALTYALIAGLFLVVPGLVIPVFTRVFIDNILVANMTGWMKPLLIGMAVAMLINGGLTLLQKHFLLRMETKMAISSTSKFLMHILKLPIEFFSQRMPGEIVSRIHLNDVVADLLSGKLAVSILNILTVIFYMGVMLYYDVVLTFVGVGIVLINMGVLKIVSAQRIIANQRLQTESGKLMGITMSGLAMIESLKASGGEADFFSRWSGQQAKVVNAEQEVASGSQVLSVVPTLLMNLNTVAILGLGSIKVMNGEMTMGLLIAFMGLMSNFITPFNNIVNMGSNLQQVISDIRRLDDAMNHSTAHRFEHENSNIIDIKGHLEMRDVSFGYNKLEKPLIEDFSLNLEKGKKIAIVGGSGSGKSTIAKIAGGLFDVFSGKILYDGNDLNSLNDEALYNSVAMVSQEIFLFEGTVRDNICMWDDSVPDSKVVEASKDACIHYDIAARVGGYRSKVDEGGSNFSGGQRQRIEIARALVRDPAVLILDEATSALDAATEKRVVDNINRCGISCLIVAHRLSTIRDCDEIIVLQKGAVVQRGTHETMKDQEEMPYAQLIKSY